MPALGGIQSRLDQQKLFFSRVPFIDEIMVDNLDAPSLSYQEVFTVRNSSRAFENITGLTGLGLFDQKAEGAPITYDALLEAYDKTFTHLTYSKGTQITREAMRDDIDGGYLGHSSGPRQVGSCLHRDHGMERLQQWL